MWFHSVSWRRKEATSVMGNVVLLFLLLKLNSKFTVNPTYTAGVKTTLMVLLYTHYTHTPLGVFFT